MRSSTILITALMGLASADKKKPMNVPRGMQKNLFTHGGSSSPKSHSKFVSLASSSYCYSFEQSCDSFWCIPTGSECCANGDGTYCPVGEYCVTGGCCDLLKTCDGSDDTIPDSDPDSDSPDSDSDGDGCDEDEEPCGTLYCMPKGSVCCSNNLFHCDEGETCTDDGFCKVTGGKDGSKGDGDQCYDFQEECEDGCMPKGSVCCSGSSGKFCYKDEVCDKDGSCSPKSAKGKGSGDKSMTMTKTVAEETSTSSEYSLAPLPTKESGNDGDDGDDSSDSSNDDGGDDNSDSTDSSSDDTSQDDSNNSGDSSSDATSQPEDAGNINLPSLLVGLVAALPLAL